jgi:hypothetical protein
MIFLDSEFSFFLYLNIFWLFWILTCLDFLKFEFSFSRTWIFRKLLYSIYIGLK